MSTQFLGLLLRITGLPAHRNIASADLTLFFVVQLIARDPKTVLVDFCTLVSHPTSSFHYQDVDHATD
jgi:hypothetical protein